MTDKAVKIANRYFHSNPDLLMQLFPKGGTGIDNYILETDLVSKIREHPDLFPGCWEDLELDEAMYVDDIHT